LSRDLCRRAKFSKCKPRLINLAQPSDGLELLRACSVLPEIGAAKSLNLRATCKKAVAQFVKSKFSLAFALFCDFVAKFSQFSAPLATV
jgi:hypothetical protein